MTYNDCQASSLIVPNSSTNETSSLDSAAATIPINAKDTMLAQGWRKEEIESLANMGIDAEAIVEVSHIERFRKFAQFVLSCEEFSTEYKKENILTFNDKVRIELARNPDAFPSSPLCPETEAFKDLPPDAQELFKLAVGLGVPEEELTQVMHVKGFDIFLSKIVYFSIPCEKKREIILKGIDMAKNPPKKRRHRKCKKEYITFKSLKGLAYVIENPDISTSDVAIKAGMSCRGALGTLKALSNSGYIYESSPSLWRAGQEGLVHLYSSMRKFLDENYKKYTSYISSKNFRGKKNYPYYSKANLSIGGPVSSHIEKWEKVVGILEALGWSAPHARYAVAIYQPQLLLDKIITVMGNLEINNPGAYLMTVLFGTASKETRIKALDNQVLHELSPQVREMYRHVAQDFSPPKFLYLACSLRSKHRKGGDVSVGDVQGIAGEIIKRENGVVNRQRPGKPYKANKNEKKEQGTGITNPVSIPQEMILPSIKTHDMQVNERESNHSDLGIPVYINETETNQPTRISDIMAGWLKSLQCNQTKLQASG